MDLAITVSDTITMRERLAITKPRRDPAGHRHKAAVTVEARDDYYRDEERWTWLEHIWDRDRDVHFETRREKQTGEVLFRKKERASTRQPIDE